MQNKQIEELYSFVGENLYFNIPDIEVQEKRYNSTLLLSFITALVGGKELIVGEPGLGKTTSAEYVSCLIYQLPLDIIWDSEVEGHPEQTEEKIKGRPDLGELNIGREEVIWSNFTQLQPKIVDEINRLPPSKQSIILKGCDTGIWRYLDELLVNEEYCLFATANYSDRGTTELLPPLLDRFDVEVESKHPGAIFSSEINGRKREVERIIRDIDLTKEINKVLKSKVEYEEKIKKIRELSKIYAAKLERELGIHTPTYEDREKIRGEIKSLELSEDAAAFLLTLIAELTFCYVYGQKRTAQSCEEGCHYVGYLCHAIENCASNRIPRSIKEYSRAVAWFLGEEEVSIEHLREIAPYALAHRIRWSDAFHSKYKKELRGDPVDIFLAKKAVSEVFNRYAEQKNDIKSALKNAYYVAEGKAGVEALAEGDHPIYKEIKKYVVKNEYT